MSKSPVAFHLYTYVQLLAEHRLELVRRRLHPLDDAAQRESRLRRKLGLAGRAVVAEEVALHQRLQRDVARARARRPRSDFSSIKEKLKQVTAGTTECEGAGGGGGGGATYSPHFRLAGREASIFFGYGRLRFAISSTNSCLLLVRRGLPALSAATVEKQRPL